MYKVSNAYKKSMKSSLRERAHIMLVFGLINQEAQANARFDSGDFTYFSNESNVFSHEGYISTYATLEEDFTKVDGSMIFLPRQSPSGVYYDTGLVGRDLVSNGAYEVTINLHTAPTDFKGITVNFGENYPVDFDIKGDSGQVIAVRGNTQAEFMTEDVLENTASVTFVFYAMKNPQSRLRVYSIRFGYGLTYYNDSVMSSTLESYVSPIAADVPQIDFTVTLTNYDKYFNVDNPTSAFNYFETGQEMAIYYGYELPNVGEIEWILGSKLLCSDWDADDYSATIRCQDVYRNMDSEYYRGRYDGTGKSYFEIAEAVLADAGIADYYLDPLLKTLYTKNPVPRVSHKEALQIIANACRCVLSQAREGAIEIKSSFVPKAFVSTNGEAPYSKHNNILDGDPKDEYGTFATNYTVADGAMSFLPRSGSDYLNTGYVSDVQSDENGLFSVMNPKLTITQEAAKMYHGVTIIFGQSLPAAFIIRTFNNGEPVDDYEVRGGIERDFFLPYEFNEFDIMEIEFVQTAEPYNRIVVNSFSFGDITDFVMTRSDMTSSPKAIRQELIKEIIVPCYSYQQGTQEETLVSVEVTVSAGWQETFYLSDPADRFRVTLNGTSTGITIVEWGSNFVTLGYSVSGTYQLGIYGYRYIIAQRQAVTTLNARGRTIRWENPLISDMEMATELAEWVGDYYRAGVEYEYDTRGNPEIDANDIVYQENDFIEKMKVNVYRTTTFFNQSFGGKVAVRRWEDG